MNRISLLILAAAMGLSICAVHADDASHRALAAKLIEITNGKQTLRDGFDSVINSVVQGMHQRGLPQEGVDEIKATVGNWYDKEVKFEEIEPKIVDIYVKDFSEDELKAILAFYESPVGQKAVKNLPAAMRDGAAVAEQYTKAKIPSLNAALAPILSKYRDKMEGAAAPLPAGSGAPGN